MTVETAVEEMKPAEIQSVVLPDYDNLVIQKGQAWIRGVDLIAFVLDCNEFGVLYQVKIDAGPKDTVVFDFEAGHELVTPEWFRGLLKETNAKPGIADEKYIEMALTIFQNKLAEGLVFKPKTLPRDAEGYQDLLEYEHYTTTRRIVPPPIRDRKKKAFHWLKAGASDTMVPKLWDPVIDNWVLPNGDIDVSAQIGFIKGYGHLAVVFPNQADEETLETQVCRIVTFLQAEGFFFDAKWMTKFLIDLGPAQQPVTLSVTHAGEKSLEVEQLPLVTPSLVPAYDFVKHVDQDGLVLYYVLNRAVVARLVFPDLEDEAFIEKTNICRM